ncbi:MAG: hypothetical protein FWD29_08610, partial [Micrococcales bacterium]|nr:hypothetical protein [Micrococcales bacterium]
NVAYYNTPSPGSAIQYAERLDETGALLAWGSPDAYLKATPPQIKVALADYDCRLAANYMETVIATQRAVEQEFLDANRQVLEEMKAAAGD